MSNFGGDPSVGDIEDAVSVLKSAADKAMGGPVADYERMLGLRRVADALEALLPRSQPVSIARIKPTMRWNGS